jgi:tRNA modification GTPase
MNFLYSDDVIIACSTCLNGNAAIGIIRISGFKSLTDFKNFFTLNLNGPIEPRKVYFTKLVLQGHKIDEICFTFFEAPHSFNGENILELSVHGNTLNIERVLSLFVESGLCRMAGPGEFTYRALKNRKLSLSQVEGLDLLLNATSGYALDQGLSLLNGGLFELYKDLHHLFLLHKASLELMIDFSDDVGEEAARDTFISTLSNFSNKFQTLLKRVRPISYDLLDPEIVLIGLPNSGKSSLFNCLLSENRAIVSPIAGTTRDYISETLLIEGIKFKLIDTAGIRKSHDLVEKEGISRTKERISKSFFKILLINPFESSPELSDLIHLQPDLILFTHQDLPGFDSFKTKLVELYPVLGSIGAVSLIDDNISFETIIETQVISKFKELLSDKPLLLSRHKHLILKADSILGAYLRSAKYEYDVAILSHELNSLGHCFSELLGIVSPEDVLNSIFSNFCIGK